MPPPPDDSFRPWQVAAAILVLVLILATAVGLAMISPLAPIGLVPVLGVSGVFVRSVLTRHEHIVIVHDAAVLGTSDVSPPLRSTASEVSTPTDVQAAVESTKSSVRSSTSRSTS